MDKGKALELLREALEKVHDLRKPSYDNKEFERWRKDVLYILEDGFSKDSNEYKRFADAVILVRYSSDAEQREANLRALDSYEDALKSILRNYEILGIPAIAETVVVTPPPGMIIAELPKAFIAHGGVHFVLDKLKNFLSALGVEPIVVEEQPSTDMTVDEKVEFYLGEADCAIILATADDEIDGKLHPRQNVVHEIGLAQKALPGKIIYLLEQYAEFPSNVRPKVWEKFDRTNMESAFIRVAKELKAFGIIRAARSEE